MTSNPIQQKFTPEDITYIRESFKTFEMMSNLTLLNRELFDKTEVDLNTINKATATNFIANRIATYSRSKLCADDTLFNMLKEDLEGWTADNLKLVAKDILKHLKLFLRYRGVYTGHKNLPHSTAIMNVINSDDPLKWPANELISSDLDPRCCTYKQQQSLLSSTSQDSLQPRQISPSATSALTNPEAINEPKNPNHPSVNSPRQSQQLDYQQQSSETSRPSQDAYALPDSYTRTAPPPTMTHHEPRTQ